MLISCEKCSTTYVLDETLIPSAGAAVQCTRCSHVFTAFPPSPAVATVLGDEPTTTKRKVPSLGVPQGRPANQTLVFGTGAAGEGLGAPPAQRPANQTMVFGSVPAQPPPAATQTMVFGSQPGPAPQRSPLERASASQTMVFGTPAGQQPAQSAAPSHGGAGNQTLVFGASPVAPPGPVSFGTAAGQQAAAREPPPLAPPPAANQTLVFGTKPPPGQALNQTMAFGTPAGQLATGALQAPPPAPAGNQTLVFGASPLLPAKGPAAPVVSGAGPSPAAAGDRPGNQTMMFGKPPEMATPVATKTMAFGTPVAVPPKRPLPKVTASGDDRDGESEPRAESTVRVDLERMMREHGEGSEGSESSDDDGESTQQRHDRTQRFAMSEEPVVEATVTPGEVSQPVLDRRDRTALFAMSTLQETTKPDAKAPSSTAPDLRSVHEPTVALDGAQTLPPDLAPPPNADFGDLMGLDPHADPPGVSTLMEPGSISTPSTILNDGPIASTMPNLSPIGTEATDFANRQPLRLELVSNSDLGSVGTPAERPMPQMDVPTESGAVEALVAQGRRRNAVAIIVVLLMMLAVGLAVAWQFFGKELLSVKVDPESQQTVVQALQHFQQEDIAVREADIARLQTLVSTNASFTDGHAALVLGLTLRIDDLRAQHAALVSTHARLSAQHETMKDDPKQGAATLAVGRRINALVDRASTLKTRIDDAWTRLEAALKVMEGAVPDGAPAPQSQRARAFVAAQQGRVVAEASPDNASDYWLRLAVPLAALNAPQPDPVALEAALAQVEAMQRDLADLPRPHFVAARLHVALGEPEKALPELDLAAARAGNFEAALETKKILEEQ